MFLVSFEKELEMQRVIQEALKNDRIYKSQHPKIDLLTEARNNVAKMDYGKSFYKEYNDLAFENKLAVDMYYYKHLLKNLDESYRNDIHALVAQTYKTAKGIYEFVNIEPAIYGKGITTKILEESIESSSKKLNVVLSDTFDNLFYSLTPDQRYNKYVEKTIPTIRHLVEQKNEVETSIVYCVKSAVLSEVLTKIAFPSMTWDRVKYLTISEDFGKIFDQESLQNLVESFEDKVLKIANYIATCA